MGRLAFRILDGVKTEGQPTAFGMFGLFCTRRVWATFGGGERLDFEPGTEITRALESEPCESFGVDFLLDRKSVV